MRINIHNYTYMYKNERNRKREEYTHSKEAHGSGDDEIVRGRGVCWWLTGEVLEEIGESRSVAEFTGVVSGRPMGVRSVSSQSHSAIQDGILQSISQSPPKQPPRSNKRTNL